MCSFSPLCDVCFLVFVLGFFFFGSTATFFSSDTPVAAGELFVLFLSPF